MVDRGSYDSSNIPLNQAGFQQNYSNANFHDTPTTPYPETKYAEGYHNSASFPQKKKGISPWIKFGLPILVVVAIAAIVAGVVASRKSKKSSAIASSPGSSNSPNGSPAGPGKTGLDGLAVFPVATDTYELPVYPKTVRYVRLYVRHYIELTMHYRPILPYSLCLRLLLILSCHGLRKPSNPPLQHPHNFARIILVSLLRNTNGTLSLR